MVAVSRRMLLLQCNRMFLNIEFLGRVVAIRILTQRFHDKETVLSDNSQLYCCIDIWLVQPVAEMQTAVVVEEEGVEPEEGFESHEYKCSDRFTMVYSCIW